jgi:5-methylcytosine-specific restriction endonuclease McrA
MGGRMKNCTECGKPIVLNPSAEHRARKSGGKPSDYTDLFTIHSDCLIQKRNAETIELIKRINGKKELDFAPVVK